MTPVSSLSIALIGDEDLVNGLRLAGVKKYFVITDEPAARENVRNILAGLIDEPGIGIIGIQEDYAIYADDMISELEESKRLTPAIITLPSKSGTRYENVAEYYKSFVRIFTGFDVEI